MEISTISGDTDFYSYVGNNPMNYLDPTGLTRCDEILWKIEEIIEELADRYDAMRKDLKDLYRIRKTGTMSWKGHQDKYNKLRRELQDLIDEYENGPCGKSGPKISEEAKTWANTPAPDKPDRYRNNMTKNIAIGVGIFAGYYLIYRTIRFLPSLLPPFWWTIPLNVATP